MKKIIILTTLKGGAYARKIKSSLNWLGANNIEIIPVSDINNITHPENCLIHSRAANPNCSWMEELENLEEQGALVINNTNVLKLTSDKAESSQKLISLGFNHPSTWIFNKNNPSRDIFEHISPQDLIIKPYISQGQGGFVEKVPHYITWENFCSYLNNQPTNKIVVQEVINYSSIYRVVCINGRALPFATKDSPTDNNWKVSVCLNKKQKFVENPPTGLLILASNIQKSIGGDINFIDIFETTKNNFVVSEINTACNLSIHERLSGFNIHYQIAKFLFWKAGGVNKKIKFSFI